jgi:hypothetical protein
MPTGDANWITISREEFSMRLTPAEVDKATRLLGITLGMENMDTLPDHITNTPFVVRFFENDKLALERLDADGSIPFAWNEADDLITTLNDGLKIAINERTLVKGARGTGFVGINQEPFV